MSRTHFLFSGSTVLYYSMHPNSNEILEQALDDLQTKRRRVFIRNGIVESSLVFLVFLGAVSLLSYTYSNHIFFSILKLFAIAGLCFGLARFLLPALLKKEEKSRLALELEKVSPGLGEEVLNAVLLSSDIDKSGREIGSKFLVKAHYERVAERIGSLDLSPAIPEKKTNKYKKPLAVAFTLCIVLLMFAPEDFRYFLLSTRILPPSEPRLLELADIKVRYEYPGYTNTPTQEVRGSSGDIRALKGTHVTFTARALKAVDEGNLVIDQGNIIPLSLEKGRINAGFVILSNGSFFIEDRNKKLKSKIFKIVSEEDKLPEVTVKAPAGEIIELGGKEKLDIFYSARDDFGLTKLVLSWKTGNGESSRLIGQNKAVPKTTEGRFIWDLSLFQSEPGEVIDARIKAYDNDTVSGPKAGVSNTIRVRIINSRKKHQDVIALAEKVQDKLLDILADEIETSRLESKFTAYSDSTATKEQILPHRGDDQVKKTQETIADKVGDASDSLDKLLQKMKDDHFSDYTLFLGLSNMRVRIEDLLRDRRNLLSSLSEGDFPGLDSLITREINEFEDDILFLDSMLKGERLKESLLYGKETLSKYNELSELMEKLRQTGDETTRKEIEKKIEELRMLMSQLAQKLSSIAGDVYEGFLNPDAFESLDMQEKLDEIMKLAQEGKIEEALDLLASMKNSLQGMIASLESGFQSLSSASLLKETTKLNELIARIDSIEKEEALIKQKTENHKESLIKSPPTNNSLLDFVEAERKKVKELKNVLTEARDKTYLGEPESKTIEGSNLIDQALRKTDELERLLLAFEFDEALKNTRELEAEINGLDNLSKPFGKTAEGYGQLVESEGLAKAIRQDIEQFLKGGTKEMQSYQIAERQDQIQNEARDLGDTITRYQEELTLSPKIGESLSESEGFMGGASRNLRSKEISKAISNQEEAIKSLKKAREEADQLLKKYQMSARGMGPSVPFVLGGDQPREGPQGIDTGYVEIPAPAGESEGEKKFKESLLKALKEGSPEGYSELNRKYYERIIK